MLKLTMKPTGWFHIGWSAEIAPGEAAPMQYFGQHLVAFRSENGKLTVMDAHCKHLGAHLGYGGKVRKDCVICPYHGWAWDEEGNNANVPYQEKPTGAKLRTWHVQEQYGIIYLWHDPAGGPPREGWEIVDLFKDFDGFDQKAEDYYPCYPGAVVNRPDEPVHPQLIQENAPTACISATRMAHRKTQNYNGLIPAGSFGNRAWVSNHPKPKKLRSIYIRKIRA